MKNEKRLIPCIEHHEKVEFEYVDKWVPEQEDIIFTQTKGSIILPISQFYNMPPGNIDYFILASKQKRCYNSDYIRNHIAHYLNYFEKFYDKELELVTIYSRFKIMMDCYSKDEYGRLIYTEDAFVSDIDKYIIHNISLYTKICMMNEDNYKLNLMYKNIKNPVLQYNNKHGMILYEISLMIDMIIPLATHYVSKTPEQNINNLLLRIYDIILDMEMRDADIYSKLYETTSTNIDQNKNIHKVLWDMNMIRGIDTTTHSINTVNNLLLQIIPKYVYDSNIIPYNYDAIQNNIKFQVTDIQYEWAFVPFSSSIRDEDENSEFDNFESRLIKQDEALYLQNVVACEQTMRYIERVYGPFEQEEIDFYRKQLTKDGNDAINQFQKNLIFLLFYKYFGDTITIKGINSDEYIKLMIAAKRLLINVGLIFLPQIIGGRVKRLVSRKSINKKEMLKMEYSKFYQELKKKYNNNSGEIEYIENLAATIMSSEFEYIDYENPEHNGTPIIIISSDCIIEDFLLFVTLI